jgi:hypothetical protein
MKLLDRHTLMDVNTTGLYKIALHLNVTEHITTI